MKNTFGNNITLTIFGESHGKMIGATLDGIASGIKIDYELLERRLNERKPYGKISTARKEADEPMIVSGVMNGVTTGTPITILIENTNIKSADYTLVKNCPRPSHADYTASVKYGDFRDYRGGGHFSGRLTAAIVAAGAIIEGALIQKGIFIGTHIKNLNGISDIDFISYADDIKMLSSKLFPVLSDEIADKMIARIESAANDKDSLGGILETAVIGVPAGIGEPWFDTLEGMLAHAIFSIPAIKGVEFGSGFGFANVKGSEANDQFCTDGEKIFTKTNNNGGINGGISNGMPIIFRSAIKPTPSIFKSQDTVNMSTMENTTLLIEGRHDPAIIHRAKPVVDAITAIVLADILVTKYGTDWLRTI